MPHDPLTASRSQTSAFTGPDSADSSQIEERVVAIARSLAEEVSGDRAARAVSATASLERDVGLGSLERVELVTRLEAELGRELGDRFLLLDTPREIAHAALTAPMSRDARRGLATREPAAAAVRIDDVTTLADALYRRAAAEPNRVHVLLHKDTDIQKVKYSELWEGAARIAGSLRARGIGRGDTVAIMLPTGLDYLQSFMGIVAAGGIAVPLYPPARLDRIADYLQRQARILANANARVMISMEEAVPIARLMHHDAPALESIVTAGELRSNAEPMMEWIGENDDAALIQYTSGSTGEPKGVVLTHANLLANMRAIAAGVDMTPTDAIVSWLPLYHDMGLIGAWLNAVLHGVPLSLMSPLHFLARPERWLWAIHEQRATLSPAPNFAFELCVRKIRDEAIEGLDLSSWRIASNGSEPVSIATLDRFVQRFEKYGFKREALFPVYGLAESSVALCFPPIGRGPVVDAIQREPFERDRRAIPAAAPDAGEPLTFVSVGGPLIDHEVRIVDEQGGDVAERVVGRLIFRGPSCMSGYYRNAEATAAAIDADGWIDSGDLAYRAAGELFITGRIKDLIIKGGRNLVPQEIEEAAGAVDGIRKGCVAAFGVADPATGTERLVVLAESRVTTDDERARLEREVVTAVATSIGVPPDTVRIVAPGAVPKTPSGKIRRNAARDAFETGDVGRAPTAPFAVRFALARGVAGRALRAFGRRVWRALQVAYLVVAITVATIVLGPIVAILVFVLPAGRATRALTRQIARVLFAISGCRIEVEGAERLPRGPAVLVANHSSYTDAPLLLAALPTDFLFVAMREVLTWPVIGRMVRRSEHVTVDRWDAQRSVEDAAAAARRLGLGETILYFAEGGLRRGRGLRQFRFGAFEAAAAAGTPVVPIALRGARELLPDGARMPRPRKLHVWIGEPIHPGGTDWASILALREAAAAAVAAHCGEPRI